MSTFNRPYAHRAVHKHTHLLSANLCVKTCTKGWYTCLRTSEQCASSISAFLGSPFLSQQTYIKLTATEEGNTNSQVSMRSNSDMYVLTYKMADRSCTCMCAARCAWGLFRGYNIDCSPETSPMIASKMHSCCACDILLCMRIYSVQEYWCMLLVNRNDIMI